MTLWTHGWFCRCSLFSLRICIIFCSHFPICQIVFNKLVVTLSPEAALILLFLSESVVYSCTGSVLIWKSLPWCCQFYFTSLFLVPALVDCLCYSPVPCSPGYLNPPYCIFQIPFQIVFVFLALLHYLLPDSHVWLVSSLFLDFCLLLACLVAGVCLPFSVWPPVSNQIKNVAFWALFFCLASSLHLGPNVPAPTLLRMFWWILLDGYFWFLLNEWHKIITYYVWLLSFGLCM